MTDETVTTDIEEIDVVVPEPKKTVKHVPLSRLHEEQTARHKLNSEMSDLKAKMAEMDAKYTAAAAENDAKSRDRVKRAEIKAEAMKAGISDLDMLKLLDLSKVEMNDDGDVVNAAAVIEEFKAAKPYAFAVKNTSSTASAPKSTTKTETKQYADMTDAEKAAWKRENLR
ncbi:MAG: hypothetical protein ACRYGR_05300 [Janthinobacterium lividum]